MKPSVKIDGSALKTLIVKAKTSQAALAKELGVSHFSISRWGAGAQISIKNATKLANALGVAVEALSMSPSDQATIPDNKSEYEWLRIYRALSPLGQAKARVMLEEIVQSESKKSSR